MNEIDKAARHANKSLGREILGFLLQDKKWWLVPLFLGFLVFAALLLLSSTAAAPFIYTLF